MNSGQAEVQYFLHNQLLGTRRMYCCGLTYAGEQTSAYWPHTAYFCPLCGDIWAREVLQHEFDYTPLPTDSWVIESRRCGQHGDGALLTGKDLNHCSPELIQQEFTTLLAANY